MNTTDTVNQKKFRSAVGGYNKEDVNQYIKETDISFAAKEQHWFQELNTVHAEMEKLSDDKTRLENELSQLRSTLSAVEAQSAEKAQFIEEQAAVIKDLQKRVNICKEQNDAQNLVIDRLKKEALSENEKLSSIEKALDEAQKHLTVSENQYKEVLAKNTTLNDALTEAAVKLTQAEEAQADAENRCAEAQSTLKAIHTEMEKTLASERERAAEEIRIIRESMAAEEEGVAYKLEMYDKISAQIGDILLNANRNADDILSAAKEEAEKIRTDAALEVEKIRNDTLTETAKIHAETEEEANYIRERLSDTANSLLSQISGDMHINIDNCIKEVNTCIQEMQYDTEHMLSILENRYREMNERVQYYQSCVTDSIEQKLLDMDEKYGI